MRPEQEIPEPQRGDVTATEWPDAAPTGLTPFLPDHLSHGFAVGYMTTPALRTGAGCATGILPMKERERHRSHPSMARMDMAPPRVAALPLCLCQRVATARCLCRGFLAANARMKQPEIIAK